MKVRRKDESEQKEAHACNGKSLHGHRGLLKLARAFEDSLSAAEIATENGELMASDLSERMAETKEDYMKKHEYNRNRISSNIIADYARDALLSVREMGGQYYNIIKILESLAISEHGNTQEQTE